MEIIKLIGKLGQCEAVLRHCRRIMNESVRCAFSLAVLVMLVRQIDYMLIQDNLPVVTVIIKKMFFATFG